MERIKPLLPIDPTFDTYAKALGALHEFASQGLNSWVNQGAEKALLPENTLSSITTRI